MHETRLMQGLKARGDLFHPHRKQSTRTKPGGLTSRFDLTKPVTVTWNGRKAFEGVPKRDLARMLEVAVEKADWRATFEAFVELSGGK